MKERLFQEGLEIHVSQPTTFKKQGIEDLQDKGLSLDGEQVTVISIKDYQDNSRTYLAPFDRPFVGFHLAQFLDVVAPFQEEPLDLKNAISNDFGMPGRAKHPIHEDLARVEDVRLHNLHEGDPDVGPSYKEFVDQGLRQVDKALETPTYDPIFEQAMKLRVINGQVVAPAFSKLLSQFRSELEQKSKGVQHAFDEVYSSYNTLSLNPIHTEFVRFLGNQPEIKRELPYIEPDSDLWNRKFVLTHIDFAAKLMLRFLEQLGQEGQERFIISRAVRENYYVVDSKKKEIFGGRNGDVKISSLNHNDLELFDNNGIRIQLEFQPDSDDPYLPCQVKKYKFPPKPLENSLYPAIAWRKDEKGQRRFLSQRELEEFLPLPNIDQSRNHDVYLGRHLLAYFSKDVTTNWASEIPLRGGRYPQKMMAAQILVWESLDSETYPHAPALLSANPIQKLEEHALATSS